MVATLALVGCRSAPQKDAIHPYRDGDLFILHVTRVADKADDHYPLPRFEATVHEKDHEVRLIFECDPELTCVRLSTVDYTASKRNGQLYVYRESNDEAVTGCRSCATRVYKIVDEIR
jgi:hypothetical protein